MTRNILLKRSFMIPIFPVLVTLMLVKDPYQTYQRMQKTWKEKPDRSFGDGESCVALCRARGGRIYLLFDKDMISHSCISHELKHAADELFGFIEAEPTQEIYEYVIVYMTELVYRLLKNNKIKLHR